MTLHLIKLCVGIDDVEHLAQVQKKRLAGLRKTDPKASLRHVTRHKPKRDDELLDGGSLYWVIRGAVRARQRVIGFADATKADGTPACAILLAPRLTRVVPRAFRAFQGWRYLEGKDAPPDLPKGAKAEDLPPKLAAELRALGLL